MTSWVVLLLVPGSLALLMGILMLSQAVEQRVLSPRAMIVSAARARRSPPEFAETFVAAQLERLLREAQAR